jgi:hypothetical protein
MSSITQNGQSVNRSNKIHINYTMAAESSDWHEEAVELLKRNGLGQPGDTIILTKGQYSPELRTTDTMSVFTLD